jgi:transcriptional regulator with XRE-family HTH domain
VRELAARSGVSHSGISLMERDLISPSVDTLSAVLDALGSTLTAFFSDLESSHPYRIFHRSDELVEIGNTGCDILSDDRRRPPEPAALDAARDLCARRRHRRGCIARGSEAGMVISGTAEVTVGSESSVLGQGDGYYFDSRLPHRFRNCGDGPCEIVSAITPPTY